MATAKKLVKIKKVHPFPIPCQIKLAAGNVNGQVLKLTGVGVLIELNVATIKPGERFECSFEIPVLKLGVSEAMVVVKLYNQLSGGHAKAEAAETGVVRMVEAHFQTLSVQSRESINAFISAIGKSR